MSHYIFAYRFDTCKLDAAGLANVSRDCFEILLQSKRVAENLQCAALIRRIHQDILACFVESLALGVLVGVLTAVSRPPFPSVCIKGYAEDRTGNFEGSDA
jgi:hypothetical protein